MDYEEGIRQRIDKVFYDTHTLEAGQTHRFFADNVKVGSLWLTNMGEPGLFPHDDTATVLSLGVRMLGAEPESADGIYLRPNICREPLSLLPGSACTGERGYIYQDQPKISVRMPFHVEVSALGTDRLAKVRVMLFCLYTTRVPKGSG
jgi:hypothetical protein